MPDVSTLTTERLALRPWRDEDLPRFAALNADPEVMEHLPAPLTRSESDSLAAGIRERMEEDGWGLWAADVLDGDSAGFIGFVGLSRPRFEAHFTPTVEIGWRLSRSAWGRGYATEGARRAADFAFGELGLDELVSMIVPANVRSQEVARRLGMTHDPRDDFDHPLLPVDSILKRHRLFRLRNPLADNSGAGSVGA
jgi:RimJ/RimL family protein N-acetyltransferase